MSEKRINKDSSTESNIPSLMPALRSSHEPSKASARPIRILFLRHDRIGDAIVSLPVLRSLRMHQPDFEIDVLLGERSAVMSRLLKLYVDTCFVYRKSAVAVLKLIWTLRRRCYDVIVDMMDNPSRTSAFLIRLLQPRYSLGFDHDNRNYYTKTVRLLDRSTTHIVEVMAELLRAFDIDPGKEDLSLEFGESLEAIQNHKESTIKAKTFDLMINISAGKASLHWETSKFTQLIEELRTRFKELRIVLGASPEDQAIARDIASQTSVDVLPEAKDIYAYAALMRSARVLLTPDTSIVHIAAALNVPSVVMYAKPHSQRSPWFPYLSEYEAIIATDEHGLQSIDSETVFRSLERLIMKHCQPL